MPPTLHFLADSKEKAEIRIKLWNKVFAQASAKKSHKNIKYLCFPGEKCYYEKYLVEKNKLLIKNCVAVEEDPFKIPLIQEEFSKLGPSTDIKEVLHGKIEALIETDDFKKLFPFDILNLDFECPAFPIADLGKSKVLTALEDCMSIQFSLMKEFWIILTFKLYDELAPVLRSTIINGAPVGTRADWLMKTYLEPLAVDNVTLSKFIASTNRNMHHKEWCSLYAIPCDITNFLNRRFKIELVDNPYTYVGESSGYRTRMVSYGFHFKRIDNPPRTPSYYRELKGECMNSMMESIKNTHWVKWNGRAIEYLSITDVD
jgi:hypothetical protein